jgi:hypothetical protein
VQLGVEHGGFTEESRRLQWRNYGVAAHVETFFAREEDSAARRHHIAQQGVQRAAALAATQPVLLIIYTDLALSNGVMELLNDLRTERPLTTLFAGIESIGAEPAPLAQLDAALTFDRERARQGLWPAIDPLRSYSTAFRDEHHRATAAAAQRLCARYRDLGIIYDLHGMAGFDMALFGEAERQAVVRARRLHRFLAQPFYVAEPWSAVPGTFTPLAETLQMTEAILAGAMDDRPEEELLDSSSWSPKWT